MKQIFFTLLTVISFGAAKSQQSFFPPIEKYKLKNGLEIVFADFGTLPVTTIDVYVNTGKKNELPGMQSIANTTAQALLLGCKNYTRTEQDNLFSELGTSINAASNDSYTHISTSFINTDIEKGMDMLSNIILTPTFPKEEISMMLKQRIDYNKTSRMDISQLAQVFSNFFVYGSNNPLGRYFYAAQLNKINRDTISEFYKFNYTPKNSKIVISGKPDKEKVKKLIEQYFASWQAAYGEINGVAYDVLPIKKKEYGFINKTKAKQVALQWNKKAPDAKSKDVIAFNLLSTVFNEILYQEIRAKKGYTYGIGLSYSTANNNGIYTVATMVRDEVTYDCIQEFDRLLNEFFTKGISQQDLDKAKTQLRGGALAIETPAEFVSIINPQVYSEYEKRKQYFVELEKIDLETVNKVVKKYFTPDSYKLIIAGDETKLTEQLNKISGLVKFNLKDIEIDN